MVADSSSLTWGGTHNDDVAVVVHTEREGATGSAESEIQVVTTSQAPMMSEIQELTIEGHPLQYEVQKVFVSSGSEIHSDSTFQLSYNARTTTSIPHDATAAQVRAAIQGVAGTGDVKVTRHRTGTRGYKWMITFLTTPHAGRPTMSMSASLYDVGTGGSTTTFTGVNGVVDETAGTREITGTFTISFGNVTTKRLPHDASARDVLDELVYAGVDDDVEVSVEDLKDNKRSMQGRRWAVTFNGLVGNQPLMRLDTKNISSSTTSYVNTTRRGTTPLNGSFWLMYGSSRSSVPHNASVKEMQSALSSISNGRWGTPVLIDRTHLSEDNGEAYEWRLTFPTKAGNIGELNVRGDTLRGSDAAVSVATELNGTYTPLGGSFYLNS